MPEGRNKLSGRPVHDKSARTVPFSNTKLIYDLKLANVAAPVVSVYYVRKAVLQFRFNLPP